MNKYTYRYPFSGLLMCIHCGNTYKRRQWTQGYPEPRIVYQCSDRTSNRSTCKKANIDLIVLEKCTAEVIHKFMSSNEHVYDDIKEIVTDCYTIDQIEITLKELQTERDKLTESISKIIDLKLQSKNSSELEIYNNKQDEYSAKLQKINFEINKLRLSSIADESMKRYDNLKNKLKEFQQGKIDIDGELIHAVINKIIVLDEHTVVYCIPKNRIQTSEEIKLFRKKYINFPAMFEGRIDDIRNKKHYYIEYKAVMI